MNPLILAIESSCDDTSVAVIRGEQLLSNVTHTQELHKKYGGVVPELASRAHMAKIIPTIKEALLKANVSKDEIDAVAFTKGPGLLGSLLVGLTTAKSIALALNTPLIEVHHMHAHILAHMIESPRPDFPFLCLTVSGGHTQIVRVDAPLQMTVLGQTIDDAAGEAFDKAGKMLGLPYPGGPVIDQLAQKGSAKFEFNKPNIPDLNFSFSGLKTSILYSLKKWIKDDQDFIQNNLHDLAASIQKTIIDILLDKLSKAAVDNEISELAIAGGVSANSGLRNEFEHLCQRNGWNGYIPEFQYCTDNAGMIAMAAYYNWLEGNFSNQDVTPAPRMPF